MEAWVVVKHRHVGVLLDETVCSAELAQGVKVLVQRRDVDRDSHRVVVEHSMIPDRIPPRSPHEIDGSTVQPITIEMDHAVVCDVAWWI